jgi:hypothetical protein
VRQQPSFDTLRFSLTSVRTESRLLIQSTCRQCGAARLVSMHDGSLDKWHNEHICKQSRVGARWQTRT